MTKPYITLEEGAEPKQLQEAYRLATQRAMVAIWGEGMSSDAFMEADAEMSKIVRRIKEILGTTG